MSEQDPGALEQGKGKEAAATELVTGLCDILVAKADELGDDTVVVVTVNIAANIACEAYNRSEEMLDEDRQKFVEHFSGAVFDLIAEMYEVTDGVLDVRKANRTVGPLNLFKRRER